MVGLNVQRAQEVEAATITQSKADDWTELAEKSIARTVTRHGRVIAVGGLIPMWKGRAIGWTYLTDRLNRADLLHIHRCAAIFLRQAERQMGLWRIEASVREDFGPGHKWAGMLGFRPEGIQRRYDPAGNDYMAYVRLKE